MESEARKRKLSEEEENSHNDLCLENQTPRPSLSQIRECIMKNWDEIDRDVQDLLSNCCLKVCQALEGKEEDKYTAGKCFINSLPEEIIIEIIKYLDYPNFCRIKRVCRKWYKITTDNKFFKRIILDIKRERNSTRKVPEILFEQLSILPARITHLNLNFDRRTKWFADFCAFSTVIREKCPNLHTLVLHQINFDLCGENLDICLQMPKNTRVVVLHNSKFKGNKRLKDLDCDIPKISVLDLSFCQQLHIHPSSFLLMPYLKVLRLAGCVTTMRRKMLYHFERTFNDDEVPRSPYPEDYFFASVVKVLRNQLKTLDLERTFIGSSTFHVIFTNCILLTELFICFTSITDQHLVFARKLVLPNVKILCLRNCKVTVVGVSIFIDKCPALEQVYVGTEEEDPAAGFSKFEIPQICVETGYKHCNHYQKVNYMYNIFVK